MQLMECVRGMLLQPGSKPQLGMRIQQLVHGDVVPTFSEKMRAL